MPNKQQLERVRRKKKEDYHIQNQHSKKKSVDDIDNSKHRYRGTKQLELDINKNISKLFILEPLDQVKPNEMLWL